MAECFTPAFCLLVTLYVFDPEAVSEPSLSELVSDPHDSVELEAVLVLMALPADSVRSLSVCTFVRTSNVFVCSVQDLRSSVGTKDTRTCTSRSREASAAESRICKPGASWSLIGPTV